MLSMSLFQLFDHVLNFVAPAFCVGLVLALVVRLLSRRRPDASAWWVQALVNTGAGVLVLLGGLLLFGQDGRIATYAALVGVMGTVQWLFGRGGRS